MLFRNPNNVMAERSKTVVFVYHLEKKNEKVKAIVDSKLWCGKVPDASTKKKRICRHVSRLKRP